MKNLFGMLAAGVLVTGLSLVAQEGPKAEMKDAGSDVKTAGKATGRAAKHAGKGIVKGTKKGVHKTADATEDGAAKLKDKTK